ncbi:MAG TPA: RNA methyltransferase [Anaerolineaceae bacterium]|nr:RNA methyltransferase [Anaerolineaceae bacterium]
MSEPNRYQIRICLRPECGFRFPVPVENAEKARCPKCRAMTRESIELYQNRPVATFDDLPVGPPVEVVLDNLRSTYNVGSIFRAADGAGVRHIHLCGITPNPTNPKIGKTALGAEQSVPWSPHQDIVELVRELRKRGMKILALEGGENAEPIFTAAAQLSDAPLALIVGNEVSGVDPAVLDACDQVIAIPMLGSKESLNVAIAFGIAIYTLRFPPKWKV